MPYAFKTLAQLRTAVADKTGDRTFRIWTSAEVNKYINDAYQDFCADTLVLWIRGINFLADDLAGVAVYPIISGEGSPTLIQLERMFTNARQIRMPPISLHWLQQLDPQYLTRLGSPEYYVTEGEAIGFFRKYPIPAVTSSVPYFVEYVPRPNPLLADGNTVLVPNHMAKALVYGALRRCFERDSPGQDLRLAEHYQKRYELYVEITRTRKSRILSTYRTRVMGGRGTFKRGGFPPARPIRPPDWDTHLA